MSKWTFKKSKMNSIERIPVFVPSLGKDTIEHISKTIDVGWLVYEEAIKNKETHWGVTLHVMDKHYDTGAIIKRVNIELHEPPVTKEQLGSIGHWFMFHLFKQTIIDVYNENYTTTPQITSAEEIYAKNL